MARTPRTLAGSLLVSHPQLRDDHFRETVILLHSHDAKDGALGVIINRPLGRELGQIDAAVNLAPLEGVPLFEGGPVATDRLAFGGWCFPADAAPDVRFGLDQEEAVRLAAEGRLDATGVFHGAGVIALLDADARGEIDAAYPLMGVLCVESWLRQFVAR